MPRRPLKSDEELLALAQRLEAQYGMVTVPALRAAAGGGSPNRLRRIIDAMQKHRDEIGQGEPPAEADAHAVEEGGTRPEAPRRPEKRAREAAAEAPGSAAASEDIQAARYAARIEELQRSHDMLLSLLREERHERQSELAVLNRLVERQNALVDQLGRMIELALKTTQSDLEAMRQEFNQAVGRKGGSSGSGDMGGKGEAGEGFSFQ